MDSREILGAADRGGGGIEEAEAGTLRLDAASSVCLIVGLIKLLRDIPGPGVAELPLASPIVISMNSHVIPSSWYLSCMGLKGCE